MAATKDNTMATIVAGDDEPTDELGQMAQTILTDITYNLIHDLLLQAHREEKLARANSAAVVVELKAQELDVYDPPSPSDPQTQPHRVETDAAVFISPGDSGQGEVHLKGNPLKTTMEIRCGKCKLPRLLYPTEGAGARKPEAGVEYCKKRPYISKPYFDIYGQTFVPEGPGRGKKKKDMVNPLLAQAQKEGTPNGSQDSTGGSSNSLLEGLPKPIPFPHAKCQNCAAFMPIKRMNNHMAKCIGGNGRETSKIAMLKMKNGGGSGAGSQNGTPPGSRSGTPVPGGGKDPRKLSPNKREVEDHDSEESPARKKNKLKKGALVSTGAGTGNTLRIKLKAPSMKKSASQHSASNLSFEQRADNSGGDDEVDASGDDDRDGEYGGGGGGGGDEILYETTTKRKKQPSHLVGVGAKKKLDGTEKENNAATATATKKKKKLMMSPHGAASKPILPPTSARLMSSSEAKSRNGVNGKDRDAASESSQSMSSPS